MSHLYKTFFDLPLLVLWGDKLSDDGKRARLNFGFCDGRPRFTLNTGLQGKEGLVIYPADTPTLTAAMLMLSDIADNPAEDKRVIDSLSHVYEDNKPTAEKKVRASLIFGKTKDGIVYITVVAEGYPKMVFPFKSSDYHIFKDSNNNTLPASTISKYLAKAYSDQVRTLITEAVFKHAMEEYTSGDRKLTTIETRAGGNNSSTNNSSSNNADKFQDLDDIAL